MHFIIEFKKAEEKKRNIGKSVAFLGGAGLVGQQTIRSGVPRLLGVRLESHSTSKDTAKSILKNGGYLDPNYGGTGASKTINKPDYIENSKNNVHITGKHENHSKRVAGAKITHRGKTIAAPDTYKKVNNNLLRDVFWRKAQRGMYRGDAINPSKSPLEAAANMGKGLIGAKGKTLYVGGSDDYFNKNFTPDVDDIALKSSNKIKVNGNRASATLEALKREGGGSRLKGLTKLVKANPKRVLAGAAITTIGGATATALGKAAYNNFTGNNNKFKKRS